jgi:hypothetical protein
MTYFEPDFSLTLPSPAPTMQPESSDGFASVGTILPEEGAAFCRVALSVFSLPSPRSVRARSQFELGCPASVPDPPILTPGFTEWDGNDTI